MALPNKVFIDSPSSSGGGVYTFAMFISSASLEKFVRVNDVVEDTNSNRYQVLTWSTFPTDFTDGVVITAQFLDNDVLPQQDGDYNSDWLTEGLKDITPALQTTGTLSAVSLFSGQNFEFTVTATWDSSGESAKAVVGDFVVDASGKVYELSFIDGAQRFVVPCRMKEVETYGNAPNNGVAALFRPTSLRKLLS